MPRLLSIKGSPVDVRWTAADGPILLGRDPECQVVLDDPRVSRRHCLIVFREGRHYLTNLSQTNGTLVNRRRVELHALEGGDEIAVGVSRMQFVEEGDDQATQMEPAEEGLLDLDKSIVFYNDDGDTANSELINLENSGQLLAAECDDQNLNYAELAANYARRLEIIRDLVNSIVSELDLDTIFERILDHVFTFVKAERGCVLLYDKVQGECVPRAVRELGRRRLAEGFPMSRTIMHTVLRQGVAILSTNAMNDDRFGHEDSIIFQGIRSVMSAPMIYQGRPLGIISVDNRDMASVFAKRDLETLSIIANLAATAIHNAQMVEQHVRMEMTRQNFERFLPPALARQVIDEGRELRLGGERAEITILFIDIRSFTSFCADKPPEEVVHLLNVFFHEMTECVFLHRGTLDKYMGDAVLAVFGCPEPYAEHSLQAARAAIHMRDVLTSHPMLSTTIEAGISLHRGEAIHGFVGSEQRIQYTVIGDSVNIASRLCDLARGNQILLSQQVVDAEPGRLQTRRLADVTLQGKNEPMACYELVALEDTV